MTTRYVVGAAVLRGGTVLAARRSDSGGWEFPGGKVEPGETPDEALVREVEEELGCGIAVLEWFSGEVPIREDLVLKVALAHLVAGEPRLLSGDHDELRWLTGDQLGDVTWLAADLPFVSRLTGADVLGAD